MHLPECDRRDPHVCSVLVAEEWPSIEYGVDDDVASDGLEVLLGSVVIQEQSHAQVGQMVSLDVQRKSPTTLRAHDVAVIRF